MDTLKRNLMEEAKSLYGAIDPCSGLKWNQCFTVENEQLCFWFNVEKSTRMVMAQIGKDAY